MSEFRAVMSASGAKILVVEDNRVFAKILAEAIQAKLGCRVKTLSRGDRAVARILETPPDLLVLDVGLPGLDGFEVCRRVRGEYRGPILFLTAESSDADHLKGFDLGADDYVCKPASLPVVLAHIGALLRRFQGEKPPDDGELRWGAIRLDPLLRQAFLADRELLLTDREFALLRALVRRGGKVCTRDELFVDIFGKEWDGRSRLLDNLVGRLRTKLGDGQSSGWIQTRRNVGYSLVESGDQS